MAKRKNLSTRGEIQDTVTENRDEMNEITDDLDIKATDTEIVRETLDDLNMDGFTTEGAEEVEETIEKAEDVTVELFEEQDDNLEQTIDKAKDYSDELNDNKESGEKDLSKVVEASGKIETNETVDELAHTKTSAMEDIEFLEERESEAVDDQQNTEQARKELQHRINFGRGK